VKRRKEQKQTEKRHVVKTGKEAESLLTASSQITLGFLVVIIVIIITILLFLKRLQSAVTNRPIVIAVMNC